MTTLQVKAVLKGKDVDKLHAIKDKYGLEFNSETIRVCINNTYQTLIENPGKEAT